MSSTIKVKRSLTPDAVPASLALGEIAINVADSPPRLYVGDGSTVKNVPFSGVDWSDAVQTVSFAAFPTQGYYVNGTGLTVSLPSSPVDGAFLYLFDFQNNWDTDPITLNGNGDLIAGNPTASLDRKSGLAFVVYIESRAQWEYTYTSLTDAIDVNAAQIGIVAANLSSHTHTKTDITDLEAIETTNTGNAIVKRSAAGAITVGAITSAAISATGNITATGNVTAYSDIKLKENIEVIPDALSKLMTLSGYTFDRIDDTSLGKQTGVIAQELQKVLPEAIKVNIDEDTKEETLSVAYGQMAGLFIEAIKELKADIEEIKGNK